MVILPRRPAGTGVGADGAGTVTLGSSGARGGVGALGTCFAGLGVPSTSARQPFRTGTPNASHENTAAPRQYARASPAASGGKKPRPAPPATASCKRATRSGSTART